MKKSIRAKFLKVPKLNEKNLDVSELKLSQEQKNIFDKIESGKSHIFVTGKAGTGKSALLQYLKNHTAKRLVVVAPTGVAALNVGGQTIHSLFKIPPSFIPKNSLKIHHKTALLLKNIDAVIIDEISMVRADLMDAIDHLLRQARSSEIPFGGVQMVMFGDMFQLPPVVTDPQLHIYFAQNYGGYYFFNAQAWQNIPYEIYELGKIFRQEDEGFKNILSAIRTGEITGDILTKLNTRSEVEVPSDNVITLATTNQTASQINSYRLNQLKEKLFEYEASIVGDLEQSAFPTEVNLQLKKNAQVMLLKNDKEKRWVNGTLGHVTDLKEDEVKVNIDGTTHTVMPETWSKLRYYYDLETKKIKEEIVSSFTQYPLRLAWAVTVHKSQGQTYGTVAVDMGYGAFANGQTYVALSRCKSLEGLYLNRKIVQKDIMVDQAILNFMKQAKVLEA